MSSPPVDFSRVRVTRHLPGANKNWDEDNRIDISVPIFIEEENSNGVSADLKLENLPEFEEEEYVSKTKQISEIANILFALSKDQIADVHRLIVSHSHKNSSVVREKWIGGRNAPEDPAQFILRVYGDLLDRSFTTKHLKDKDAKLYVALGKWRERGKVDPDADAELRRKLPSYQERNDELLKGAPPLSDDEVARLPALRAVRKHRGTLPSLEF